MKEINILILNDIPDCYNKNKSELEKNTHNTTSFRVKYLHVMGIIYVYQYYMVLKIPYKHTHTHTHTQTQTHTPQYYMVGRVSEEVGKLWASGTFIFPFFELQILFCTSIDILFVLFYFKEIKIV